MYGLGFRDTGFRIPAEGFRWKDAEDLAPRPPGGFKSRSLNVGSYKVPLVV